MLPPELWGELELDPDDVRQRARFFEAYAEMAREPPAPSLEQLIALASSEPAWPDSLPFAVFGELPDVEDREWEPDLPEEPEPKPAWIGAGERADALREAALAQLLLDATEGRRLLARSGEAYLQAGLPYGLFAQVIGAADVDAAWLAAQALAEAFTPHEAPVQRHPFGRSNRAPTQQLYLMLAAASHPAPVEEYRSMFGSAREHLEARSALAVGSTGMPLGDWWSIALDVVELQAGGAEKRSTIARALSRICLAHGGQLRQAQWNRHQWTVARSAVNLVDLDLAGTVCLAARSLRRLGHEPLTEQEFGELSPLASVSLTVGLQMAGGDEAEPQM